MKSSSDKPVPASGKHGAIRFGAVVPLLIVCAVVGLYFKLFFDVHLRHGLEYAATQANGAEVNIGGLDTSLWNASIAIHGIALTDPAAPGRNRVQIGSIRFSMLWDALLRGKVAINEASISDIQIATPRSRPGFVLPVKKISDNETLGNKTLAQLQEEFSGNVLGDLAAVAAGTDPKGQLTRISGTLKSGAKIDELLKSLDDRNRQWQERLKSLPSGDDIATLQKRLSGIKLDNAQDIRQIQSSLQELQSIRSDIDGRMKTVRDTGSAVSSDMNAFKGSMSGLDALVKEDVRDLQARLHLPSLDSNTLSRALFGMDLLGKVQEARGYMEQARSRMPVKDKSKDAVLVQQRDKGHDYAFGRPNSYPRFWLRRASISSSLQDGSTLSGEILDVSSDPALTGRPMIATIRGGFPEQGVSDIKAELMIDHTSSLPVERLQMKIGRYDITGRSLVSSPNLELGFSRAQGAADFVAELSDNNVDVRMNNRFTNVALTSKAPSNVVREMIAASIAGLDSVNLDAHVTGTWNNLDWQLSSNLADALDRGMRRYLQGKVDAAKAQIEAMVSDRIAEPRKRLYAREGEIESSIRSVLTERQSQIDKLKANADSMRDKLEQRIKSQSGTSQQKLKQESDKLLDNLRKKF